MTSNTCPCGGDQPYHLCCGSFLTGQAAAPTPEALMRSRYCAFYKEDVEYLMATLAPEKRVGQEAQLRQALLQTMAATTWLGLLVLVHGQDGDRGTVEFAAFFEQNGSFGQIHERSDFIRCRGRWFYRDGVFLPDVKIGRNQSCVCGSGKKFKQCHGRK